MPLWTVKSMRLRPQLRPKTDQSKFDKAYRQRQQRKEQGQDTVQRPAQVARVATVILKDMYERRGGGVCIR